MKKALLLLLILLLTGCAASTALRKMVDSQTTEYQKWGEVFSRKLNAMPPEQLRPFTVYFVAVIGEDKTKLPLETYQLIDKMTAFVAVDRAWTDMDKAQFIGMWDRFWVVLATQAAPGLIAKVIEFMSKW